MEFLKSILQSIYINLSSLSPHIELFFRRIYWNNVSHLQSVGRNKKIKKNDLKDFNKVTNFLGTLISPDEDILVLHSSYEALANTDNSPKKIINMFLDLLGEQGTLAMNSARSFKEESNIENYLSNNNIELTNYNVKKSKVWTGALPFYMIRDTRAVISRFPINPMVAIGKHASEMMENNLLGDNNSSCGPNSSWKYCSDKNALIVGLGLNLVHSLTIIHVAEENHSNWPFTDWYRNRRFRIIDGENEEIVEVKERKPKWGTLHFAELTLRNDLLKAGVLHSVEIDGLNVEYLRSMELINFLNSKNKTGYPYYKW